jgi:hypothetical protein
MDEQSFRDILECHAGAICKDRLHSLREYLLSKSTDIYARDKIVNFSMRLLGHDRARCSGRVCFRSCSARLSQNGR